jgi:hypothetical protein
MESTTAWQTPVDSTTKFPKKEITIVEAYWTPLDLNITPQQVHNHSITVVVESTIDYFDSTTTPQLFS